MVRHFRAKFPSGGGGGGQRKGFGPSEPPVPTNLPVHQRSPCACQAQIFQSKLKLPGSTFLHVLQDISETMSAESCVCVCVPCTLEHLLWGEIFLFRTHVSSASSFV